MTPPKPKIELLANYPAAISCSLSQLLDIKEDVVNCGGSVTKQERDYTTGRYRLFIEWPWPASRREPITIHGPRIPQ